MERMIIIQNKKHKPRYATPRGELAEGFQNFLPYLPLSRLLCELPLANSVLGGLCCGSRCNTAIFKNCLSEHIIGGQIGEAK